MFKWIQQRFRRAGANPVQLKVLMICFLMALIYGVLGLMNFTDLGFDLEKLTDKVFWIKYGLIISVALVVLVLAIMLKKTTALERDPVKTEANTLKQLRTELQLVGLYDAFEGEYIKVLNKLRKLDKYRDWLIYKRDSVKKQSDIDKYTALFKATTAPDFDIDAIKSIAIRPVTANLIFWGLANRNSENELFYTGRERLHWWLLSTLIVGMTITAALLAITMSPTAPSAQQWKDLITTLGVTIGYMLLGLAYGDYSINNIYYAVLCNRKDKVLAFLHSKGKEVYLKPNPAYKELVVIETPKPEEVKTEEAKTELIKAEA